MEIIYYYLVASVFPRFWHCKNKGCLMSGFLWRRKWQTLQYSCLENPMDRGAWWATVHGVTESDITEHTCMSGFSIMHRSWAVQSHTEILINIQNVVHWRRQWRTTSAPCIYSSLQHAFEAPASKKMSQFRSALNFCCIYALPCPTEQRKDNIFQFWAYASKEFAFFHSSSWNLATTVWAHLG